VEGVLQVLHRVLIQDAVISAAGAATTSAVGRARAALPGQQFKQCLGEAEDGMKTVPS
jgi:hypothetical protein